MARITRGQIGGIYAIAARLGWDNDRLHDTVADNYHVEHISQLTAEQAAEFINLLQESDPKMKELKTLRNGVIKACAELRRLQGYDPHDIEAIKTTCLRKCGMPRASFNAIPASELRSLYHILRKEQQMWRNAAEVEADLAAASALVN